MNNNDFATLKASLRSKLRTDKNAEFPAFLGDHTGTVAVDTRGNVYVSLLNGEVLTAYNGKVPNVSRLPVVVGYAGGKQLQVLRSRNVFVTPPFPDVPPHASLHTFPGPDTIAIRGEQFIPGLVVPSTALTVKIYGFAYQLSDGWHALPSQELDLTSYVPGSGALYVLLEADTAGTVQVTSGSAVDERSALEFADIPDATADRHEFAAVKLYVGQSTILHTLTDTDIIDLRWGRAGGLFPSGANRVVFKDASDAAAVSNYLKYTDANKRLEIGESSPTANDYNMNITAQGSSAASLLATFADSATLASYIAFIKGRGTASTRLKILADDVIGRIRGRGYYDDTALSDTRVEMRLLADGNWALGDTPTRIEFWTTPTGSGTMELIATIDSNGIDLALGKEFTINGSPIGGGSSSGAIQRVLSSSLTLADGECLVLTEYINPNVYDIILEGDANLRIL